MSNEKPEKNTVSVVLCTYNGARYLCEQLDSILAQDCPILEIIVQDDGSTDDTLDLLKSYRDAHPGLFRLYRNTERLGFCRNFHTAMLRARGEFVAISDQDDIWFPQKIRRQLETIGTADICLGDYFTDPTYAPPLSDRVCPSTCFEHQLFYDGMPGHGMLLRADFVRSIATWDYTIYYDWWLGVHAFMGHGLVKVDEPLNWHRHHAASATTRILRKGRWEPVAHPTWQPYVLGYAHRLHLQRKGNWQHFYGYLAEHIDPVRQPVARRIAQLQLRRDPLSLLRLCFLCGKHFRQVHPSTPTGWKGRLRGFFFPLISAYGCDLFKLEG